ncbi:DUF3343 domain-containing protein [Paenibacillus hunanensis]|uniref:Putative Se/S carrier protein-like domain-containing protein n=1 Tax=Paenibacillus hunanensis TaxID=539262 RepID=A0ABU1J4D8_9BACL|nr:DUF3343 domain-containing protein [Paenibacillus hunanensis]MCL9663316.1 DUF3343 domain-containing protein [Paenibacillus hunanensis]MDR6246377.1 hypothetical protein [Paenibacillus hunanensis]GGJ31118.1 hypothetical protein GCM10008022_44760 [Paenibacillus hunanensis]
MDSNLVMAFDSTQQALRAEMLLEYADIENDMFPTPKQITAGCALSLQFPEQELEQVQQIIAQEQVEIRGIFRQQGETYIQIES